MNPRTKATSSSNHKGPAAAWGGAGILLLCAWVIFARWTKMDSLYNHDPAMWLDQVRRFAEGELPYRDFSYVYPPFTIYLLGWIASAFGATFTSMQVSIDVISLLVVGFSWWLVQYLLSPIARFFAVAAVVVDCSTTLTMFNLFSFTTYSPALEIAAAGLLMVMVGGVRQLKLGDSSVLDLCLLCVGTIVCTLTKPEAALASWAALVILFLLDQRRRWWWYGAIAGGIAIVVGSGYLFVAQTTGLQRMMAGVQGYGLASFACPYWPTGYGVFGAIAAIGESIFIATALLWPARHMLKPTLLSRMRWIWMAGAGGFLVFAAYVWYQSGPVLLSGATSNIKLETVARSVIWTSPVLLPAMWTSICIWVIVLLRRGLSADLRLMVFVLTVPVAMSARSLFGTTLVPHTEVTALGYPFFILITAYLIEALYGYSLFEKRRAVAWSIAILLGGYSLLRIVGAYPTLFSNSRYYALETNAGTVHLSDNHISEQIYSYIISHTNQNDMVLELPYGSGFNFASKRPSPAFTTMFVDLRTSTEYQQQDLANFRKTSPRLVIADPDTHFGAFYGLKGNMNCAFPRLVWEPDQPSWDPTYVFPAIQYIEDHYQPLTQIGPKVILSRSDVEP